ncbi:hypothetical protein FH972_021646 [Carpinus fangiana]|uniref:NTF2 domain-containing protein n=1 Tax=Carpinus fangiana TaxID=176857 RepID=A0A5N6KS21_9ROSI|nr:hypothetical protein FH972_021646 [Carpinus fangiana]
MAEDDEHKYNTLPIPTYEEATSSRPHSSQSFRGPQEVSDDAERERLLDRQQTSQQERSNGSYRPPRVESTRDSYDSITSLSVDDTEEEALRQDMEQMEFADSEGEAQARHQARIRSRLHQSLQTLSSTLSSLHLPSIHIPWLKSIRSGIPSFRIDPNSEYKPTWPIIARVIGLLFLTGAVYSLVALKVFGSSRVMLGQQYVPESIRSFVQGAVDRSKIEGFLKEFSYEDHVAGTRGDFFLAQYIEEHLRSANLDEVAHEDYYVYLNYPKPDGRRVAIVGPPELEWQAGLEEDDLDANGHKHQSLNFHGHSRSGDVTGPLIYANYGARKDFAWLKQQGIPLNGSIVLVRHYGSQIDSALKVKAAELAGAAGCVIYSDPAEDGFRKGEVYPDGPWRPEGSVQRGAVSLMSWVVGDVLTPGHPSVRTADRLSIDNATGLVGIPSIPLSWRDAKVLLASLQTQEAGLKVPDTWQGGVPDITYWTGGLSSPTVNLKNIQDEEEMQPIRNVLGRIDGYEDFKKQVYVGNHRDAWCFGSVDPGSGTAVFMEVVRIFGELIKLDWRPRRSIVFASWDGAEYNLIGSTEHVEDRVDHLRQYGLAYLNVEVGVAGKSFRASSSPLFARSISRVLDRVSDPASNSTLRQLWNDTGARLGGLDRRGDYVAFQNIAGMSSIDFGFEGESGAYPSHSCYDNLDWMRTQGDSGFAYHVALAQIWALLILQIADEPIVPYDFQRYAEEVNTYVLDLEADTKRHTEEWASSNHSRTIPIIDFKSLKDASATFSRNAGVFMFWEEKWQMDTLAHNGMESQETAIRRISHNSRMLEFESHLLDLPQPDEGRGEGGIPGREQFKHIIFGPQKWGVEEGSYFPAVRDRVADGDWEGAQVWINRIADILAHAAEKLVVVAVYKLGIRLGRVCQFPRFMPSSATSDVSVPHRTYVSGSQHIASSDQRLDALSWEQYRHKIEVMPERHKSTPPLVSLISGGVAGGIEAATTYPFEFAKTRVQLRAHVPGAKQPRNPFKIVADVYTKEGLRALYKGCGALIIGSVAKDGVRFLTFDSVKNAFKNPDDGTLSPTRSMLAGMSAGVVASVAAVTPTERIKTALIDDARDVNTRRFQNSIHAVRTIIAEDGWLGLYRGFAGTTLKQASATSFRMGSYNILKDLEARKGWPQDNTLVTFGNGAMAGIITTLCTQPFDTIKTRSQSAKATTTMEAIKTILLDDGIRGFWKGTVMRLGRTVFSGGILFTSAEAVAELVGPMGHQKLSFERKGSHHSLSMICEGNKEKMTADAWRFATPTTPPTCSTQLERQARSSKNSYKVLVLGSNLGASDAVACRTIFDSLQKLPLLSWLQVPTSSSAFLKDHALLMIDSSQTSLLLQSSFATSTTKHSTKIEQILLHFIRIWAPPPLSRSSPSVAAFLCPWAQFIRMLTRLLGQSLPFEKVAHQVETKDAQPSSDEGGILVLVSGKLLVDEEQKAMNYTQTFQLRPESGSYYVYNDIFRAAPTQTQYVPNGKPILHDTSYDEKLLETLPHVREALLLRRHMEEQRMKKQQQPSLPPHFLAHTLQADPPTAHEKRISEVPTVSSIYTQSPEQRYNFDDDSKVAPLFTPYARSQPSPDKMNIISKRRLSSIPVPTKQQDKSHNNMIAEPAVYAPPKVSLSKLGVYTLPHEWQGASGGTALMTPIADKPVQSIKDHSRSVSPASEHKHFSAGPTISDIDDNPHWAHRPPPPPVPHNPNFDQNARSAAALSENMFGSDLCLLHATAELDKEHLKSRFSWTTKADTEAPSTPSRSLRPSIDGPGRPSLTSFDRQPQPESRFSWTTIATTAIPDTFPISAVEARYPPMPENSWSTIASTIKPCPDLQQNRTVTRDPKELNTFSDSHRGQNSMGNHRYVFEADTPPLEQTKQSWTWGNSSSMASLSGTDQLTPLQRSGQEISSSGHHIHETTAGMGPPAGTMSASSPGLSHSSIAPQDPRLRPLTQPRSKDKPDNQLRVTPVRRKPTPSMLSQTHPVAQCDQDQVMGGDHSPSTPSNPDKDLPPAPPTLDSIDLLTSLEAELESLSNRRTNLTKMITALTSLDTMSPVSPGPLRPWYVGTMTGPMSFAAIAEVNLEKKREDKERVKTFEAELADVRMKEHEVGLRLLKAWKRREENVEAPSALWVRRAAGPK